MLISICNIYYLKKRIKSQKTENKRRQVIVNELPKEERIEHIQQKVSSGFTQRLSDGSTVKGMCKCGKDVKLPCSQNTVLNSTVPSFGFCSAIISSK